MSCECVCMHIAMCLSGGMIRHKCDSVRSTSGEGSISTNSTRGSIIRLMAESRSRVRMRLCVYLYTD